MRKRQTESGSDAAILLRSLGMRLPPGYRIEAHHHDWHQLVYATEGVLTVATETGAWVVPPERGVWIPAGLRHSVRMTGTVRMQTLYARPRGSEAWAGAGAEPLWPTTCSVLGVTPLVRELILEVVRIGMLFSDVEDHVRLAAVLASRLENIREVPLEVTLPTDPRARRVADRAREDLAVQRTIAELSVGCGASARTVERIFRRETGLTFARWLQRVRALRALELLASGESVTRAALAVGYDSPSAFIAMFKRVLGRTPGAYFQGASAPDLG